MAATAKLTREHLRARPAGECNVGSSAQTKTCAVSSKTGDREIDKSSSAFGRGWGIVMRLGSLIVALTSLFAIPVLAADFPRTKEAPPPTAPIAYNWSGFYI